LKYIGVFAGIGHGKKTSTIMFDLEILIGEFSTINYSQSTQKREILDFPPVPSPLVKSPPTVTFNPLSLTLDHKFLNNSMEKRSFIPETLLA
jgi:hypothetical protein